MIRVFMLHLSSFLELFLFQFNLIYKFNDLKISELSVTHAVLSSNLTLEFSFSVEPQK